MARVILRFPDRALRENADGTAGNAIATDFGVHDRFLWHFGSQGKRADDTKAKLLVIAQDVVRDGQTQPVSRRTKRAREKQAAALALFDGVTAHKRLKRYRVRFGKEADKSEPIRKALAHRIVGDDDVVTLTDTRFGKDVMSL